MARAILSWIPSLHNSPVAGVVYSLTEPYLSLFRGIRFRVFAGLDLSFLWAIIFLQMVQMIFRAVSNGTFVAARDLIWFVISSIGSLLVMLIFLILLLLIARLIVSFSTTTSYSTMAFLDRWTMPITNKVRSVIAPKRMVKIRTLLLIAIIAFVGCWFLMKILLVSLYLLTRLIPL